MGAWELQLLQFMIMDAEEEKMFTYSIKTEIALISIEYFRDKWCMLGWELLKKPIYVLKNILEKHTKLKCE